MLVNANGPNTNDNLGTSSACNHSPVASIERGELVSQVMQHGVVQSFDYTDDGTHVIALVDPDLAADLAPFALR